MERETKELTTPVEKKKIIVKTWLTGREKREIQSVFSKNATFKGGSEFEVTGDVLNEAQDLTIRNTVISVDGVKEDVLNLILDMHEKDTRYILTEIDKMGKEEEEEIKK